MQEYTVIINGRESVVLATSRIDAVIRAMYYGSDAVEYLTEDIWNRR